jgi:hypothetical protein
MEELLLEVEMPILVLLTHTHTHTHTKKQQLLRASIKDCLESSLNLKCLEKGQ